MSLESEIKALTAAINRWCDTMTAPLSTMSVPDNDVKATPAELAKGYGGSPEQVAKVVPRNSLTDPTMRETLPPVEALTAVTVEQVEQLVQDVASIPALQDALAPTFDDAKRAFLAIAQKYGAVEGTAKSKEVLSRYGVPNLKALGAEQYPDFIALCGTVVEGGVA